MSEDVLTLAPASPAQRRMWFLDQLTPGDPAYHMFLVDRLRGPLDAQALQHAVDAVVARHEILRTRFPAPDGQPRQEVLPPAPVPIEHVDLTGQPPTHAEELVAERTNAPFDLAAAPPLRVSVFRLGAEDHVLCLVLHHMVADGWSLYVWRRELAAHYAYETLPDVPVQYKDSEQPGDSLSYWTEQLSVAPPLDLPTDHPRPSIVDSTADVVTFRFDTNVSALARQFRATPFMVLFAACQALLAQLSGQQDFCTGVPVAARDRVELEPLIGPFAGILALRPDLSGDPTFAELVKRVRSVALGAFTHGPTPLEQLVETLDLPRDLSRNPLYQTMFAYHTTATGYSDVELPGLTATPFPHGCHRAKADLSLELWPQAGGVHAELTYRKDLFDKATATRITEAYVTLLSTVVEEPDTRLSALWPYEDDTAGEVPNSTVVDLVRQQRSDAVAVVCGDTRLTYAGLVTLAERVAADLVAEGVETGDVVAVALPRSAATVGALLGIMLAGAAYLPIDPEYPKARIDYVLTDSDARVVITDEWLNQLGEERFAGEPGEVAYVIYTSGSTGKPKGVVVPHRALTNLLVGMQRLLDTGPTDVWLALTSLSFDISALELFLPLVCGGRVVVATQETAQDGTALARLVRDAEVTHAQATPSGWRTLLDGDIGPVTALVGGEALPLALARELRARMPRLVNMYGPTETTIWSTAWEVPPSPTRVSIGRPLLNTQISIVDGELRIGGAGVAIGYHNRPELTAERFTNGWYRTGDRVRRRTDGELEFLGRLDEQVKVRGHRIEPGEVEAALEALPTVGRAVVVAREDRLVAYVTGSAVGVQTAVAKVLPAYLVPDAVVELAELPMTLNGKVDRKALPAPERATSQSGPPRTAAERRVAAVFAEVLSATDVGIDDDFFALGGHSLLATKAAARLGAIPVRRLFTHPTVAALATTLTDHADTEGPSPRGEKPAPLSPAQERLWFLHRLDPNDASYTMYLVRRLIGRLDVTALERACTELVARHEVLRTRFPDDDGRPVAVIEPPSPAKIEHLKASSTDEAHRLVAERVNAPIDLASVTVRFTLIRLAEGDHVLCVVLHHIAADGWSLTTMLSELSTVYAGGSLPPLPVQHGDVALWQREQDTSAALEYWRRQLAEPPILALPVDAGSGPGQFETRRIPSEAVNRFSRHRGVTLFMTLLAAYQVLLARHSGQSDVLVGSPTAGRERVELEPLVGYLSNTLVLRGKLHPEDTFTTLLQRTRDTVLEAMAHQEVPFEELLAGVTRNLDQTPLFQTMAVLHSQETTQDTFGSLKLAPFDAGYRQAKFALMLEAWQTRDGLLISFAYDTGKLTAETVAAMADRFTTLLAGAIEAPDSPLADLPLLTEQDHDRLAQLATAAPTDTSSTRLPKSLSPRAQSGTPTPIPGQTTPTQEPEEAPAPTGSTATLPTGISHRSSPTWASDQANPTRKPGEVPSPNPSTAALPTLPAQPEQSSSLPAAHDHTKPTQTEETTPAPTPTTLPQPNDPAVANDQITPARTEDPTPKPTPSTTLPVLPQPTQPNSPAAAHNHTKPTQTEETTPTAIHPLLLSQPDSPAVADDHTTPDRTETATPTSTPSTTHSQPTQPNPPPSASNHTQPSRTTETTHATTLPALLSRPAYPDAPAVVCGPTTITHGELLTRVERLAASLQRDGVTRGSIVAVSLPRSIEAIVALFAIWRAGAAYLPLDPSLPPTRATRLLNDSGPTLVLDKNYTPHDCPLQPVNTEPGDAAYVIYTSGSTGTPKGVVIEHGSLATRTHWMRDAYALSPTDHVVQLASLSFDTHAEEIYPTLTAGATLVLLPDGATALPELLAAHPDITVLDLPTAYFHQLVEMIDEIQWPPALRLVIIGGEQVRPTAVTRWQTRFKTRLINTYGPTETTIIATAGDLDNNAHIGSPIADTTIRVLDPFGRLAPPGAPGELAIGGLGVARGYLGQPGRTAERFVPDSWGPPGSRLYLTGDQARWRPDGHLEFLGRLDNQLKVRGFRIEPGEVEAALLTHPAVREVTVAAVSETLVAYVVTRTPLDAATLRDHVADLLPAHLVPSTIVFLPALPLTISGKVDRSALHNRHSTPPGTDTERAVAAVWAELLDIDEPGIDDDFFDLGGHSLLAVRVVTRLGRRLGHPVAVMDLFQHPTIRRLAALIDQPTTTRGLLHRLTPPRNATTTYVCVPYGGGSAAVYQPLADALSDDCALWSVAIPGHDVGLADDRLPFDDVAAQCVREILRTISGPLVLYGHSGVGAALAVEIAYNLEAAGRKVDTVYLGAVFPFARPGPKARLDKLRADRTYANWLAAMGVDLGDLDPAHAKRIIRNMRRDTEAAEEYFTRLHDEPRRLTAPVVALVGDRDPATEYYQERFREWHVLTDDTSVVVLDEAGHFFLKYRATELAEILTRPDKPGTHWRRHATSRSAEPVTGPKPSMGRFLTVAAGQLLSLTGSALTQFALPLWIYLTTGSLAQFALFAVIGLVPGLLAAPLAGAIVDRTSRRTVMLWSDGAAGGTQLVLGILLWTDNLAVWHIYLLLASLSVALAFQRVAYSSAVPQLVPKRFLGHANGIVQLAGGMAQLVVPLVAVGLMAGIGLEGILVIDVATYTFAVLVTLAVRFPATMAYRRREPVLTELAEGFTYSWRHPGFRRMLLFFACLNVFLSPLFLMVSPLVLSFGTLADAGTVSFAGGLGVLVGGVVMTAWGGPRRLRMRAVLLLTLTLAVFCLVTGLRADLAVIAAGTFGMSLQLTLLNGVYATIVQVKVPQRFHGRVFALNTMVAWSTLPIGFGIVAPYGGTLLEPLLADGGALASTVGTVIGTGPGRGIGFLYVLFGVAIAVVALVALRTRLARFDDEVPDATPDDLVGLRSLRSPGNLESLRSPERRPARR